MMINPDSTVPQIPMTGASQINAHGNAHTEPLKDTFTPSAAPGPVPQHTASPGISVGKAADTLFNEIQKPGGIAW